MSKIGLEVIRRMSVPLHEFNQNSLKANDLKVLSSELENHGLKKLFQVWMHNLASIDIL